jgi:hypothetical protein
MPHIRTEKLIKLLLKTHERLQLLMLETKNVSHEEVLRKEMEKIEKIIRKLERTE